MNLPYQVSRLGIRYPSDLKLLVLITRGPKVVRQISSRINDITFGILKFELERLEGEINRLTAPGAGTLSGPEIGQLKRTSYSLQALFRQIVPDLKRKATEEEGQLSQRVTDVTAAVIQISGLSLENELAKLDECNAKLARTAFNADPIYRIASEALTNAPARAKALLRRCTHRARRLKSCGHR
jgi:hypothetical protein